MQYRIKAEIPASAAAKEKPSTKSKSAGKKINKNNKRQAPGHGEKIKQLVAAGARER